MWSVDDIISWRTCYHDERWRELCAGRNNVTPEWWASLGHVPVADRVCLLIRHEALGPERQLRLALRMAGLLLDAGQDATQLHAFMSDDSMRPNDPSTGHARDYCPQPLTWMLVRLSARLHLTRVLSLSEQLQLILEAYDGR